MVRRSCVGAQPLRAVCTTGAREDLCRRNREVERESQRGCAAPTRAQMYYRSTNRGDVTPTPRTKTHRFRRTWRTDRCGSRSLFLANVLEVWHRIVHCYRRTIPLKVWATLRSEPVIHTLHVAQLCVPSSGSSSWDSPPPPSEEQKVPIMPSVSSPPEYQKSYAPRPLRGKRKRSHEPRFRVEQLGLLLRIAEVREFGLVPRATPDAHLRRGTGAGAPKFLTTLTRR
jgi:hypothetical protein